MNRRKIILVFSVMLFFIVFPGSVQAQEKVVNNSDALLKEALYKANKVKVLNFSLKQFDALFFEFFDKKANSSLILTKEEFYKYTIQIAIFSDRLAALYPDQKEIAAENKKKWFAESYEDYLLSKATQKK
jgi:phosphatidate phosphatase PAH1